MRKFQLDNWFVGMIMLVTWIIVLLSSPILTLYEEFHETRNPSFAVSIDIDKATTSTDGKPRIKYTRVIHNNLSGTWQAYIQDVNDTILCGGSGDATYSMNTSGTMHMNWAYFLGKDCAKPTRDYKICTSYTLKKLNSNTKHSYGPYCSEIYEVQ